MFVQPAQGWLNDTVPPGQRSYAHWGIFVIWKIMTDKKKIVVMGDAGPMDLSHEIAKNAVQRARDKINLLPDADKVTKKASAVGNAQPKLH